MLPTPVKDTGPADGRQGRTWTELPLRIEEEAVDLGTCIDEDTYPRILMTRPLEKSRGAHSMNDEPSCSNSRAHARARLFPPPTVPLRRSLASRLLYSHAAFWTNWRLWLRHQGHGRGGRRRAGWRRAGRSWGLQRERGEREAVTPSS